jgi:CheY-like chemotaxis protein
MGEVDYPELRGKRVLVVDDDADSREMLAMLLERCGAQVIVAESASQAVAAFAANRPDAMLLDLGLPDEDGFTLLKKLQAMGPGAEAIPALALTGYGSPEDREQSRKGGFRAHLVKPVALSDVLESVARAVRAGSDIS